MNSIDLSNAFAIPGSFPFESRLKDLRVPVISNGTLWSNEIDIIWLFGGASLEERDHDNMLWRFNLSMQGGTWTEVDKRSTNLTGFRPSDGAGCNVPSRARACYLGGTTASVPFAERRYFHSMTIFDMQTEKTTVVDVPDYVPILGQSLVYLPASKRGILDVLGVLENLVVSWKGWVLKRVLVFFFRKLKSI